MVKFEVVQDSIAKMQVDAIVNAANNSLLGGGGVDGVIHLSAGRNLLKACKALNGCETGDAKLTPAFKLPAEYVIHTVGPIWRGGNQGEDELLASCYLRCLEIATAIKVQTMAFPNISTGVYDFPKQRAAKVALNAIEQFFERNKSTVKLIYFNCWDKENLEIYKSLLE